MERQKSGRKNGKNSEKAFSTNVKYGKISGSEPKSNQRGKRARAIKSYSIITLGALVAAVALNVFLVPFNIVAGGVTGIATLLYNLFRFPMGITMLVINLPLFLVGIRVLGGGFGLKTFYGTIMLALWVEVTRLIPPITGDTVLAVIAGGTLLGVGLGSVFLAGATTGGTDVAARLGHKLLPFVDVGQWMCLIDFVIIVAVGFLFKNYELSLYGLLALVLSSFVIDLMLTGANYADFVYILSPKNREIAQHILNKMERGVTGIYSRGMYSGEDGMMLMCVVKKFELARLKRIISEIDDQAFIIMTQARKVSGEGFRVYPQ